MYRDLAMDSRKSEDAINVSCGLTLEDEFVLTRIRTKAHALKNAERDQYMWEMVYKLILRERAFKAVMDRVGIAVEAGVDLFDELDQTEN